MGCWRDFQVIWKTVARAYDPEYILHNMGLYIREWEGCKMWEGCKRCEGCKRFSVRGVRGVTGVRGVRGGRGVNGDIKNHVLNCHVLCPCPAQILPKDHLPN